MWWPTDSVRRWSLRSVDPLLAGVYAGSAATIGLRSAAPGVAAQLDAGAASLTEAARTALPPASGGPVFRAVGGGYQRLVDELVRQGRAEVVQTAVTRLCRTEDGWHLVGAAGEVWRADAVALAVPAPQLAGVVADAVPSVAAAAAEHSRRVVGGGRAGRAGWHIAAGTIGGTGGQRRAIARQGDHAVEPQVGSPTRRGAVTAELRTLR